MKKRPLRSFSAEFKLEAVRLVVEGNRPLFFAKDLRGGTR